MAEKKIVKKAKPAVKSAPKVKPAPKAKPAGEEAETKKAVAVKKTAEPSKAHEKKSEGGDFTGKYIQATGRRKTAAAQVRLYENGKGVIMINGQKISQYFPGESSNLATQALRLSSYGRDLDFSVIVRGGGKFGQAEAVRHGIARALVKLDEKMRDVLKTSKLLTRDRRKKERKKPGLKKARKAPQWSKR